MLYIKKEFKFQLKLNIVLILFKARVGKPQSAGLIQPLKPAGAVPEHPGEAEAVVVQGQGVETMALALVIWVELEAAHAHCSELSSIKGVPPHCKKNC